MSLERIKQRTAERVAAGIAIGMRKPTRPVVRQENRRNCIYLGAVVEFCHKCNADIRHVHDCSNPENPTERCTLGLVGGLHWNCKTCSHYTSADPESAAGQSDWTRHLIYHVYPVSGNGAWQRNVKSLVERLRIFNGKIIVTIVIDPPSGRKPDPTGPHSPDRGRHYAACDSPEVVMDAFGEWREHIEFIVAENDPTLREAGTLISMLERLPSGPKDVTLYAQAKGTTRHKNHIAQRWSEAQYIVYLDYWPLVAEHLQAFAVTGAFKKLGPGWTPAQSKSDWHYSGSWFWFRNADLFARDWRKIDQFWSGIEPYPSQHFLAAEAGCLFLKGQVPHMNLYRHDYWRRVVEPELKTWRRSHVVHENTF